ncbi:XRE family transcriptional regulator, partial [Vibrio parahaemolyticus]|uniref:XRE family transcriptional regulator n=2 Tax=Vibrio parahaemolyticus TaxID=670 RepID=UPI0020CA3750
INEWHHCDLFIMTIANRLRVLREEKFNISKREMAERLGVSQSAVNQWEKGINLPSQKHLITISEKFDVSYEWLINGTSDEGRDNGLSIAYYSEVNASGGKGFFNGTEEKLLISRNLVPIDITHNTIALKVCGDSMSPAISDCSLVFVDMDDTLIRDGKIYVFVQNDVLRVKRLEYHSAGILIKSINPSYKEELVSFQESNSLKIIGRVTYSINSH